MSLEELEKLCSEATPGPWSAGVSDSYGAWWHVDAPPHKDLETTRGSQHPIAQNMRSGDADLLVASRSILPKLIALAKAVKIAAYPGGFYDTNLGGDIFRALEDLEKP